MNYFELAEYYSQSQEAKYRKPYKENMWGSNYDYEYDIDGNNDFKWRKDDIDSDVSTPFSFLGYVGVNVFKFVINAIFNFIKYIIYCIKYLLTESEFIPNIMKTMVDLGFGENYSGDLNVHIKHTDEILDTIKASLLIVRTNIERLKTVNKSPFNKNNSELTGIRNIINTDIDVSKLDDIDGNFKKDIDVKYFTDRLISDYKNLLKNKEVNIRNEEKIIISNDIEPHISKHKLIFDSLKELFDEQTKYLEMVSEKIKEIDKNLKKISKNENVQSQDKVYVVLIQDILPYIVQDINSTNNNIVYLKDCTVSNLLTILKKR